MDRKELRSKEVAIVPIAAGTVSLGTLQATSPQALVEGAAAIAGTLAGVIKSQRLSVSIQGKEYVRVEGWTTLAVMLGVVAREVECHEEFGVYTAVVELVRMSDGAVISRASSECGEESPWCDRPRFARRSMSQTRATGKACRLAFSWIMALAGYEVTPSEEMETAVHATGNVRDTTVEKITLEQAAELQRLIDLTGANKSRFCAYLKIRALTELEASRFEAAKGALARKGGAQG